MGHDKLATDPLRISLNRRKISANFLTVHRLGLNAFHWINNHYCILGIRIPDIIYLELKLSRALRPFSNISIQYCNYHHTLPVLTNNVLNPFCICDVQNRHACLRDAGVVTQTVNVCDPQPGRGRVLSALSIETDYSQPQATPAEPFIAL